MLNKNVCPAYPAGEHWVLAVNPEACMMDEEDSIQEEKSPIAIHFVVDNSGSMGSMTREVMYIFADMVDSVATAPCSMTVFAGDAKTLAANITSAKQMRELNLPAQGMTNIPAGVENAIKIISENEMKRLKNSADNPRTHHVLILLSDGHHNTGPAPDKVFPTFTSKIPDDVMLSTVVVGLSEQSSTSMGMLLKKSIETVSFQTENVQTIYFAKNNSALRTILGNLEAGLNSAVQGTFHEITAPFPCILQDFASKPKETVRVHAQADTTCIPLLCNFAVVPKSILVNGQEIALAEEKEIPFDLLTNVVQGLIDKTKVKIVAAKNREAVISKSVKHLDILCNLVKAHQDSDIDVNIKNLSAKERVKHYRKIRALTHKAAELKNQIVDIANFSTNDSEGQAAFLNGRSMKYAKKALRRAANKDGGVVDPKAEQRAIYKHLTSESFRDKLKTSMALDTIFNVKNLKEKDMQRNIFSRVVAKRHIDQIWEIRKKAAVLDTLDADPESLDVLGLSPGALDLIHSGQLADYLNDGVHGRAQSFVSMCSPWQHAEEWLHFGEQPFESSWEMLMYGGVLGYPIHLKRFAACQMNPFLLQVEKIRSTLVDSASICCANKAEVPVYGPEAGAPIEDVLLLIDPSMPRTSKLLNKTALLGEKFTSVAISRDMHMYTGFNMRIALHSTSLFHLAATQDDVAIGNEHDVVANLRRQFMGRAFMCGNCSFGPVDHFACGDLMSHHGEQIGQGVRISNACPKCGWFSQRISDWSPWDGVVDEDFLREELGNNNKKPKQSSLSESRIDMMLKVVYSFRKMCMKGGEAWEQYQTMANAMENNDDVPLDFSTKAGVDGMSQVALALLAVLTDSKNATAVFQSKKVLMAILKEECARDARSRFRMETGGEKEMARQKAMEFLTELLQIAPETAPETQPFMDSEPPMENVRLDCRDDYQMNTDMVRQIIPWVRDICRKWCRVWSIAEGLAMILSKRPGGWKQLEVDMETGVANYANVIKELKEIDLKTPRELLLDETVVGDGTDLTELQSLFAKLGVAGIVFGAAETRLPGFVDDTDSQDEDNLMSAVAREMRMRIYLQRVATKMSQWKAEGQTATYSQARVADIVQFADLVGARPHVHGLDKQTFWGLWLAAVSTHDQEKAETFLSTCNEGFRSKHGDKWKRARKRSAKS